jgi:hypothetical protein
MACTYRPKNVAILNIHLVNFIYFLIVSVTFKLKNMHSISWDFSVSWHENIPLWRVRNILFVLLLKGCNYVGITVPLFNDVIVCHCVALRLFLWKRNEKKKKKLSTTVFTILRSVWKWLNEISSISEDILNIYLNCVSIQRGRKEDGEI